MARYFVPLTNIAALLIFPAYFICMFIIPCVTSNFSWDYIQSVWHSWQSLNVGMLAFLSSYVALNISRYNEEKKRQREFIASRASLPQALSNMCRYLKACAVILEEAWPRVKNKADLCKTPLESGIPDIPDEVKDVFVQCISTSNASVGDHLALILNKLQVNHARLEELKSSFSEKRRTLITEDNIISYMYSLGELQSLVNTTFNFARGEEEFSRRKLEAHDFHTAYKNLDIDYHERGDLVGFTERTVSRAT